jgi:RimJ/RimL family protein N-acetyltransferase
VATDRLVLRAMAAADAPALAAYRDDPETARHQEWALPYTADVAARFVAEQATATWPPVDDWYQIAVEHEGELIGDVGVWRSRDGADAIIGYTLAPGHRGQGYAVEAVGAVVDILFALGVHRITATLDPANHPSAAVVERLGFRYEGRSVGAALVRGQWLDDDRYALLATDRAAWLGRRRDPPAEVALVEIDWHTAGAVSRLATHQSQRRFVATVADSYTDALWPEPDDAGEPVVPWIRAITADGELAGFVMVAEATATSPDPYLWRLLVDRRHQSRDVGRRAVMAVADRLRAEGHRRLFTSWVPGRGSPEGFYRLLGFVPTGEVEDGETVGVLDLEGTAPPI